MKFYGNESIVYVHPVQYPDIVLDRYGYLNVYGSGEMGKWLAGLSPYSIGVKFDDRISRLRFDDLLKRSQEA